MDGDMLMVRWDESGKMGGREEGGKKREGGGKKREGGEGEGEGGRKREGVDGGK